MDFITYGSSTFATTLKKQTNKQTPCRVMIREITVENFANSRETEISSKGICTAIDFLYFECRAHYWPCCRTLFYGDVRVLRDIKSGILFLSLLSSVCMVPHKQHNPCET